MCRFDSTAFGEFLLHSADGNCGQQNVCSFKSAAESIFWL